MSNPKLTILFALSTSLIVFSACKKDAITTVSPSPSGAVTESVQSGPKNECRLLLVEWPFGTYGFQYNANGLCSQIQVDGQGIYQQQYNNAGRLLQSRYYSDGMLEATIVFGYNSAGLINKETRYMGNSNEITDEIFITRNNQGLITRLQSFMNSYVINAQYSPNGNNTAWQVFVSNQLAYAAVLDYRQPVKNHFKAVKGIDYGFPFINGFMFQSKFTPASEKLTIYDEFGDAYPLYDIDPDNCMTVAGFQNYPSSKDWFDRLSQGWTMYNYYYDNCGPASSFAGNNQPQPQAGKTSKETYQDLMMVRPGKSPAQTMIAARNKLLATLRSAKK
jgi:hypothetical protein